jgi:hypothetical protein
MYGSPMLLERLLVPELVEESMDLGLCICGRTGVLPIVLCMHISGLPASRFGSEAFKR